LEPTDERHRRELESLFGAAPAERYQPSIGVTVSLLAAAALLICSMPLPWHHRVVPAGGYTVIDGIRGASWLLVVAAILVGVVFRLLARPPGYYVLALLAVASFAAFIGMYADYVDDQDRAAQLYVAAYVGPGFFVALAALPALVLALVRAWRHRL
jgi:hypothetical protein